MAKLIKQLARDSVGHGEATINNARIIMAIALHFINNQRNCTVMSITSLYCGKGHAGSVNCTVKRDNVGHWAMTINNAATVVGFHGCKQYMCIFKYAHRCIFKYAQASHFIDVIFV